MNTHDKARAAARSMPNEVDALIATAYATIALAEAATRIADVLERAIESPACTCGADGDHSDDCPRYVPD